jgi:hypothetical protein
MYKQNWNAHAKKKRRQTEAKRLKESTENGWLIEGKKK